MFNKKLSEALKMTRVKVSQFFDEQANYWRAKHAENLIEHEAEKKKIEQKLAAMDAQIKILVVVSHKEKVCLQKLGLYGKFSKAAKKSFEFPTQAEYDQV